MAVSYMKLWHLLLDRRMTKGDLERAAGVSHYTMTQMGKDKDVSTEALRNIIKKEFCRYRRILKWL